MGTRSAIGYKTPQGKIRAKYSHYDGYPAGVGRTLLNHYTQTRKIAQMVELGDQSFLAEEIFPTPGSKHSFATPEEGVTVFYGRDRGESNTEAVEFDTVQEFVEYYTDSGCEYFYLIQTGGEWIYHDRYGVGNDTNGYPVFDFLEPKVEEEVARLKGMGYDI
jgi:hypothetical protein